MQTPDWNKIAGVAEAAERYKNCKPSPHESAAMQRIFADFMSLSAPAKIIIALGVVGVVEAQVLAKIKS
jgi:hypothetical protein